MKGNGAAAGNARGRSVAVGLALLLVLVACVPQPQSARAVTAAPLADKTVSPASSVAQSLRGLVTIDKEQFAAAVPPYVQLGVNYTIRVSIENNAKISVPVIIQLIGPVEEVFVHPRIILATVQPDNTAVANFSALPFGLPHGSPFNLTAQLFIFFPASMSSPLLVDQASDTISTIGPNPYPYLELVIVVAVIVSISLVAVFYPDLVRKGISRLTGGAGYEP